MSKTLSIGIGAVLIIGIGVFVFFQTGNTRESVSNAQGGGGAITMADVASHSNATNCWAVINGAVYDLTSWIPEHPGGQQAILQLCGTDGSEKFNNKHGGQEPMVTILAGFRIGELTQ
jgi:hypothetical protein